MPSYYVKTVLVNLWSVGYYYNHKWVSVSCHECPVEARNKANRLNML